MGSNNIKSTLEDVQKPSNAHEYPCKIKKKKHPTFTIHSASLRAPDSGRRGVSYLHLAIGQQLFVVIYDPKMHEACKYSTQNKINVIKMKKAQ